MSKRFGRNQRRKMREEIAALAQSMEWHARAWEGEVETNNLLRDRFQKAESLLRYTAQALANLHPNSAFKPAGTDQHPEGERYRVDLSRPEPVGPPRLNADVASLTFQKAMVADLNVITVKGSHDDLDCTSLVHVFLKGTGKFDGVWAYAVSDSVLERQVFPADAYEWFRTQVAGELLAMMTEHVKSRRGARYARPGPRT